MVSRLCVTATSDLGTPILLSLSDSRQFDVSREQSTLDAPISPSWDGIRVLVLPPYSEGPVRCCFLFEKAPSEPPHSQS